jgi:hypothetical protein
MFKESFEDNNNILAKTRKIKNYDPVLPVIYD